MKLWTVKPLGEVSEMVMGQAPPGNECNFDGKGTPFVKAGEFGESRPVIREWTTKPLKLAKFSDVLVCVVGATCGKLNLGADCAIGRSVAAIRPKSTTLNQGFLYAFLRGWTLRLRSGSQGSAQGVITRDMLQSIPILVPPLTEQERIVKLLDEADEMRKLRAQADQRTDALIPSLFHAVFGDSITNPMKWPIETLGEALELSRERVEPAEHLEISFNYIGLETIESHTGRLLPYQPTLGAEIKSTKNVFHRGEILYGKLRPYLNKVYLTDRDGICSTDIYVFRPREDKVHRSFAEIYLRSSSVLSVVSSAMAGANLPRIGQDALFGVKIPVPPLSLQKEFAQRVIKIRELEAEQAASRKRLDELFEAMLHRAFRGEL